MQKKRRQFIFLSFVFFALALNACGDGIDANDAGSDNRILTAQSTCELEDDCDADGVFSICDADDSNPDVVDLLEECDPDADGYADTPCTSYGDLDGDGFFGDFEHNEIGVNCDVCPGYNDDQSDADADGVGDLCVEIEPNITLNAEIPEDEQLDADESGVDGLNPQDVEDDVDGDGLGESIDPNTDTPNDWGYIQSRLPFIRDCVPETLGLEYNYVSAMKTTNESPLIQSQRLHPLVAGVVDPKEANLDSYACSGESNEEKITSGIYIVTSHRQALKKIITKN